MKPTFVLLLTAGILAPMVPLHAQGQPSPAPTESPTPTGSPAATASPAVYEPLPTLDASVILQPQYFPASGYSIILTGVVSPMTAEALAARGVNVKTKALPGPLQ